MQLFEREAKRKDTLDCVVRQIARQAFAAKRGKLDGVIFKGSFHGVERWWIARRHERASARLQILGCALADTREHRAEAGHQWTRERRDSGAPDDDEIVTQPQQRARMRARPGSDSAAR